MPTSDLPRLYLISDRAVCAGAGRSLSRAVEAACRGGARLVQVREKDLSLAELTELARELLPMVRRHGGRLLINSRASVAAEVGADGVHLTSDSPDICAARAVVGADRLIGVSTHSLAEAVIAEHQGADFVVFSPVFPPVSKTIEGPPAGLSALREVCAAVNMPVFALGGIMPSNVGGCLAAGAYGAASVGAILGAADVAAAAAEFVRALNG